MSEPWLPSDHGAPNRGLRASAARGLTWTFAETWGRQLLNLGVFVVLARLLTPVDFGVVALASVFVALAQLVVDQGLGDALIQRREITRRHIDTAFWAAVVTGVLLTGAGLLLAGPIAALLDEPELAPILQVLSLTFVLGSFSSIQIALLRREFAFRSLAIRAIGAAAGGGVVGIVMALLGMGAWALVGQMVASAVLSVLLLWWVSPWRPSRSFSREHFRELFGFGVHVVGSDILSFVSRNIDNLLIGVVLGTVSLGYYAVAYRILTVTQTLLVNVARKIAFPAFSRLQDDPQRLVRAYYRVTRGVSVIILPGYVGLAVAAPELIVTVFGSRWAPSAQVAAMLFLIGPVLTVQAFAGSLLNAAGFPQVVLRFRLITSVTNVIGFIIAVQFGILAVAAAFVIRGYLLMPLILYWMRRYASVPPIEYLRQLVGVSLSTALMAAAMLGIKAVLADEPPSLVLAAEVAVGAVTFVAALWYVERRVLHEVVAIARESLARPRGARGRERERSPAGNGPADLDPEAAPEDEAAPGR